jgi:cobalt-zinc-cadmium efflux system outer membrane protein
VKRHFLVALVLTPAVATAQEPLTPAQAVALARSRGPMAGLASGVRLVAEGRARTDAAWPNPIAEWRRENFTSAIEPDVFATLQVPVDVTGRRQALRQASATARARAQMDSLSTLRHLELEVLRAFWRAALAQELANIAVTERDARVQAATFDTQRFREGAVAEVVAMRGALEADRARMAATTANNEWLRTAADLARLLGMSVTDLGALPTLQPPALDAPQPGDTAWSTVVGRRPDLGAVRLAREEAERRARAEARGRLGDINVVGGYKGTGGFNTGLIGVLVPLPLFNRNEGPRERARGEELLARSAELDLEWRARSDLASALVAWESVRQAARDGAGTLDDRATEVARIAEAAYREGATSQLELLEAQRARADTRAIAARWAHDAQQARLDLRRATGLPFLP